MSDESIEHIVIGFLASAPAIIAAISSIKNGVEQKRVRAELQEVNGRIRVHSGPDDKTLKKKSAFGPETPEMISNPDWYSSPKLW